MFHISLRGIIKSPNKEFAEKLKDFVTQNGSEIEGAFWVYEVNDFEETENDSNKGSNDSDL